MWGNVKYTWFTSAWARRFFDPLFNIVLSNEDPSRGRLWKYLWVGIPTAPGPCVWISRSDYQILKWSPSDITSCRGRTSFFECWHAQVEQIPLHGIVQSGDLAKTIFSSFFLNPQLTVEHRCECIVWGIASRYVFNIGLFIVHIDCWLRINTYVVCTVARSRIIGRSWCELVQSATRETKLRAKVRTIKVQIGQRWLQS